MADKELNRSSWFMESRYFLLAIVLSFVIVAAIAFLLSYRHHATNTEQILKEDRSAAKLLSLVLEQRLKGIVAVMESYSRRPLLIRAVRDKNVAKARVHLLRLQASDPDITILIITDRRGTRWMAQPDRPESSGQNFAQRDWYKNVSKERKTIVSDVVLRVVRERDTAIQISVPVFDEKQEVIGILTSTQRTVDLGKLFIGVNMDPGSTISVADRKGRIIFSSRYAFEKEITPYPFLSGLKKALASNDKTFAAPDPAGGGQARYISFAAAGKLGWIVMRERDKNSIFQGEYAYFLQIAASAFFLFLAVVMLLAYSRKQATARQLRGQLQLEKEKSASAARFRSFIDATMQIGWTTNGSGEIVEDNPSWSRYTGRGFEEIKGMGWMEDIHPDDRGATERLWAKAVADKGLYENEYRLRRGDGVYRHYLARGIPLFAEDGNIREWVGACMDISERKQAETIIQTRLRLVDFAASHSLDELLQKTLDEVCAITESPIGFYHFVEPDQKTLSLQAWSTRTLTEYCQAQGKGLHYGVEQAGVWVDCIHQRRPVIHNDYAALAHRKGLPAGHAALVRELVVPIFREGLIVAILGIGNRESHYTEKDTDVVSYFADVAWEIARRKRAEEELQALFSRQQAMLAAIPDIIMEVNENKVYTWANHAGFDFFGPDVLGKDAAFYFVGEQQTYGSVKPLFNGAEDTIYLESWQRRRDGEKRLLAWWCRTLKDEGGRVTGALSSARDITAQKQAEEEIRKLNAELEERVSERTAQLTLANRELEAFSYSVSHDLRAPLRSIDGFSQALLEDYREKPLDDAGRSYLVRVRRATQRMGLLIDDMLKLSRITKAEMKVAAVDLSGMVSAISEEFQKNSPDRVVAVTVQGGIMVQADPDLLKIAIFNLLDNAFKFTGREAHPHIEFGAAPAQEGGNVCFIRDDGVGFDMAYVGKLFGAFQRLQAMDEFPGTGIGLATVQRVMHRHGGRVWAEGEIGKGATFYFTLPSAAAGL